MSIWILTTGNSDVILKHQKNWGNFYGEVTYDLECTGFASPVPKDNYNSSAGYTVPARVLGYTYSKQPEYFESDLSFPLLETYREYFTGKNIKLDKIIVLLTDQDRIFNQGQRLYEKCPYWQDTCTLKPLLEWYFQKNFPCEPEFLYLTPNQGNQGIDNWNHTLAVVTETFRQLDFNPLKTVYVSHQAGTPAISSAVQFVSLGKFNNVQFLVSNEYFDDEYNQKSQSEAIQSSNYWRGMQIQKAQQLIMKGLPAAAQEILKDIADDKILAELSQLGDLFNINTSLAKGQEFEVKSAINRVIIALDLVEIFFEQENYIQGVAILNATQETFLKAAIVNQTKNINGYAVKLSSLLEWRERGLCIAPKQNIAKSITFAQPLDILKQLNFPIPERYDFDYPFWEKYQNNPSHRFKLNNSRQFQLLQGLRQDFKSWQLLAWSCQYDRESVEDLRNQLLHNLQGVKKSDLIKYLLGNDAKLINSIPQAQLADNQIVSQMYQNHVRKPFMKALKLFGLLSHGLEENQLKLKLQDIANSLMTSI